YSGAKLVDLEYADDAVPFAETEAELQAAEDTTELLRMIQQQQQQPVNYAGQSGQLAGYLVGQQETASPGAVQQPFVNGKLVQPLHELDTAAHCEFFVV
ncbi:hypothetical protein Ciccas_011800, partial [Cichlidogyrus casuarinus]